MLIWNKFVRGGKRKGFADAAMQTFKVAYYSSLVRETIQNSIGSPANNEAIVVRFQKEQFPIKDMPGSKELIEIFKACIDFLKNGGLEESDDAIIFYKTAIQKLNDTVIDFLVVSDENTLGIEGDDNEFGTKWWRMFDVEGMSPGSGSASAGSFGLGKNAPLNISQLRTLFYSTKTKTGVAFKGWAKLSDFDLGRVKFENELYYCNDNNLSVRNESEIPEVFRRNKMGTSIYIAGAKYTDSWIQDSVVAVLENFYAAICSKQLIVFVDNEKIDHITISDLVKRYETSPLFKEFFYAFLHANKNDSTHRLFSEEIPGIGLCKLYVAVDRKFSKKIDYMRHSKMKIYNEKFSCIAEPYSAVFICEGLEGSKILRLTEGADHSSWSPKNIIDISTREKAQAVKNKIREWIRKNLNEICPPSTNTNSVFGSEDFLPDPSSLGSGKGGSKGSAKPKETEIETARELLTEPGINLLVEEEIPVEVDVVLDDNGVPRVKKRKPKFPPDEPVFPPDDPITPPPPKNPRKYLFLSLGIRLIKDDKYPNKYDLIIDSPNNADLFFDLHLIASGKLGPAGTFYPIVAAKYFDGSAIIVNGSILNKVKIGFGLNKYSITTISNNKYSFKIEGYESK